MVGEILNDVSWSKNVRDREKEKSAEPFRNDNKD